MGSRAEMLCLLALCFGNARDIGEMRFGLVAGPAKDLEVFGFIIAAKGQRDDVIDVPRLARVDALGTSCTGARPVEEERQAEGRGKGGAPHSIGPQCGRCLIRWT